MAYPESMEWCTCRFIVFRTELSRRNKVPTKPIEPLPDQGFKTLTLRLPVEVYTQIASLATEERRSLQNQLLVLLEQALERQPES